MSFQSFHFLVFFVVVLFVVRVLLWDKEGPKKTFLLAASYYFYMCWDWRFAGLILAITAVNFVTGPKIQAAVTLAQKRFWLGVSLIVSLGILAYFKYFNFFIESANSLVSAMGFSGDMMLLSIVLPVGISFYTFQSISYTLDIYKGRTEPVRSFRDFALFVSFFPQLVAGPIVRASYFLPQLESKPEQEPDAVQSGLALIIRGFIKKIAIADVLAVQLVDPAFSNPEAYSPVFLLIGIYAYSFQVYMDFSGYTDIARGVARTLGYELQINFRRPYKSLSIGEFWQRWHISMSSFFRDYLYFGLGGTKSGNVYVNLFITFVAIGIWHGAGWNFVAYGFCHASLVCYERFMRNRRRRLGLEDPSYTGMMWVWRVFWIFNIVSFTRLLFRGGSIETAGTYASALLDFSNTYTPFGVLGVSVMLLAVALHYVPDQWTYSWKSVFVKLPAVIQAGLMVITVFCLIAISSGEAPFVYFQF
ncbi:MAG: MBOAT family protein [Halioglobus sp.]